jgi:hypothetical protein
MLDANSPVEAAREWLRSGDSNSFKMIAVGDTGVLPAGTIDQLMNRLRPVWLNTATLRHLARDIGKPFDFDTDQDES